MKKEILSNLDSTNLLKMKLQFFADPDGGDDNTNPDGNDENHGGDGGSGGSEIELPKTQAELDAAINRANQKAIENARKGMFSQEDVQAEIQKALQKEKDYADLSEAERKQKEFDDQVAEFNKKQEEFKKQQLENQIEKDMIRKGLPVLAGEGNDEFSFATLFAQSGDSEQALKAVGAYEKAFKEAVAAEVKESLKQPAPGAGGGSGTTSQSYGERVGKRKQKQNGPIFGK